MNEIEARGKIKYRIANEMRKYCENKEEYEDLEIALQVMKEIREYRAMEERLNGISVKQVVDGFVKQVENETQEEYKQGRILTNKEAKDWNEYREIGTVEELKAYKLGDCMNDCEHYDNCSNYIYSKGYNKAIDEFVFKISQEFMRNDENGNLYIYLWIDEFKKIAEQMKGGATDECTGSN